ncbi:MAG: type II secretion system protein [Pseudomonadota bacterium]
MSRQSGFTLMELIGVMAILAVLSAVIAPSIVGTVNDAYGRAEAANLRQIAEDLELFIRRNSQIPSGALGDWTAAVGTLSDAPVNDLALNRRGFQRVLYFDPNFFVASGGFAGYLQTGGLTAPPLSPRVMLISNLRGNVTGLTNNAAVFDDIWNQRPTAALFESDTLFVQRLNLGRLFKEVLVSSAAPNQAAISFNNAPAIAVPAAGLLSEGVLSRFVLQDSRVLLYADPFPIGGLQTAYKATEDLGLRYTDLGGTFGWLQP